MIEIHGISSDDMVLSSNLKDIEISSDNDVVSIEVLRAGSPVFSCSLANPNRDKTTGKGAVTFSLGSFISDYMRQNKISHDLFGIRAAESHINGSDIETSEVYIPFTALFSDIHLSDVFSLENNFLTLFPSKLIPDSVGEPGKEGDIGDVLHFYHPGDGTVKFTVWFQDMDADKAKDEMSVSLIFADFGETPDNFHAVSFTVAELMDLCKMPENFRPVRISASLGERSFDWWIVPHDKPFSAALSYKNPFMIDERIWFYGSWQKKIESSFSTAVSDGAAIPYDREMSCEFTIESHRVASGLFRAMSLIGSVTGEVQAVLNSGRGYIPLDLVLDKSEWKSDPQGQELPALKLTLIPKDKTLPDMLPREFSVFTEHFNSSFS